MYGLTVCWAGLDIIELCFNAIICACYVCIFMLWLMSRTVNPSGGM